MRDVQLRGFLEHVSIDEASARFLSFVDSRELEVEEVRVDDGLGRVLGEDVYAEYDVPGFDRSAMDGYAVRSVDTVGASNSNPLVLRVTGVSEMGFRPDSVLEKSAAVRISTGAPLPEGADAVVMLEYARDLGGDRIEVYRTVTPYENVSRKGEDIKKGHKVLARGTFLQPQDVGILAAVRREKVEVFRRLRIAVISTGDELVELGEEVKPGKIIDVNRHTLISSIRDLGCEPVDLGIAPDDLGSIKSKISEGLESADIALVSGGISVGARDIVSEAVNSLGKPGIIAHGISMRPGMPTALAVIECKPLVLCPGNPVAAWISFKVFVKPLVAKMLGTPMGYDEGQVVKAKVTRKVASVTGFRTFLRVIVKKVDDSYIAEPIRVAGSGIISSLVKANGIVVIPEWKEGLEEDEEVEVELLRPLPR